MKNFQFSKYCSPAQLYLVLGAIGIITAAFNKFSIETLLTHVLLLLLWTWVLNWLCSNGFKAISWMLVLLPYIALLFAYFFIKDVVNVKEGKGQMPGKKPPPGTKKTQKQIDYENTLTKNGKAREKPAAPAVEDEKPLSKTHENAVKAGNVLISVLEKDPIAVADNISAAFR